MNNIDAVLQIPQFSKKILGCFTTDNAVISHFALRENKSARQKANYFYQNTVISKTRTDQRKIMLSFISTMLRHNETIGDFCVRQFNNHSTEFIRLKVNSPDELLAVLNGLYSSNIDHHLNRVFRAIATRTISSTFEEIVELNKDFQHGKNTIVLGESSLTDTVYAYAAPTLNRFLISLCVLLIGGLGCFMTAALQGVFTPFNLTMMAQLITPSTEYRLLYIIGISTSMLAMFLLPVGLGFYLTDKLNPLKRVEHVLDAFNKTVGCCILFFGALCLSYFSFQAFEQKNPLTQMVLAKEKESAFAYIDQNFSTYQKQSFMKAQVILALNKDQPLDTATHAELRNLAQDFVPVENIDDVKSWNQVKLNYPGIAIKEIKTALFAQEFSGFHKNKSFLQFLLVLISLTMIFTAYQSYITKKMFENGSNQ
ncbi:hypothetical protein MUB04_16065 [Acinetobacter indicus]|uniref:hypothetical protein n=1 Tax=Acinetobacter TaxID=469 RepID=UPI0015D23653|nr:MULTISPECIES: hypothetical protein [Acinetobacter]MCP0918055.1 hypothetical protein [Acinetobacter indicus]